MFNISTTNINKVSFAESCLILLNKLGVYKQCHTTLVETLLSRFILTFEGNTLFFKISNVLHPFIVIID